MKEFTDEEINSIFQNIPKDFFDVAFTEIFYRYTDQKYSKKFKSKLNVVCLDDLAVIQFNRLVNVIV